MNRLIPVTSRVSYWFLRELLVVLGPAQLDSEHDPVAELVRRYGRRDARGPNRLAPIPGGDVSSDALVVLRDDDATIKRPFREFEQAEDADVRILAAKADAPCQPIDPRAVATDRTTVTA